MLGVSSKLLRSAFCDFFLFRRRTMQILGRRQVSHRGIHSRRKGWQTVPRRFLCPIQGRNCFVLKLRRANADKNV